MHLFIYYEVPLDAIDATLEKVRALQAALVSKAGVVRLMRRTGSGERSETWMEVYEHVSVGFDACLAAAVAAHLPRSALVRKVERFVDIA